MSKKNVHKCNIKDNRGTSIIELLVVMAIMGIFIGTATNITGMLSGKQAKQCAYKLESALSEIRMETMSKSTGIKDSNTGVLDVYLTLNINSDGEVCVERNIKGKTKEDVIGKNVTVNASKSSGSSIELAEGTDVNVYFERSTGALHEDAEYCEFQIMQGNVIYVVKIVPATGKISYERL